LTEELDDQHAVAGIDPHKHTATISLVDARGALQDVASFAISPDGLIELLAFLSDTELVIDRIGVEGTGGLGRPVVTALSAAGYDVREVQANRTAERRRRRRRAKTDIEDAEAIARETLAHPELPRQARAGPPTPPANSWSRSGTGDPRWSWRVYGCSPRPRRCWCRCPCRCATPCRPPAGCCPSCTPSRL